MFRRILLLLIVAVALVTACNKIAPTGINPEVLGTTTPAPSPETGKASVTGVVKHQDGFAMANTVVRLAVVARGAEGHGGAYILDIANSPGTVTDLTGRFLIPNITPGEYVIVVGDIELTGIYEIIKESNGQAKVWNFPADQVSEVGTLTVNIVIPTPIPTLTPGPYPEPTAYPSP